MNATTFQFSDLVLIVNATYDDLRDSTVFGRKASAAFSGPNPAETYDAILPGEGEIADAHDGKAPLSFLGIGAHEGSLYAIMEFVYHYRNDATRYRWGGSADKPEDHLPSKEEMTALARADFERAKSKEHVELLEDEYKNQHDGGSTDDRHLLLIYFPIDEIESSEKLVERCLAAIA